MLCPDFFQPTINTGVGYTIVFAPSDFFMTGFFFFYQFMCLTGIDVMGFLIGLDLLVEMSGLEPPTSCLTDKRSPS